MKHSFLIKNYPDSSKIKHYRQSKNYYTKFEYLTSLHRSSKAMKEHELEIWGVAQILDGLCYHYKKFKNLEKGQSPGKTTKTQFNNTINEITAYLNRLGQIYSCLTSEWFQKYVTKDRLPLLCPSILALIPYRNKYSAHRSLDRPYTESQSQHESYSNITLYNGWHGKSDRSDMHIGYQIKISAKDRCKLLVMYHPLAVQDFEHFTGQDEIFIDFVPVKHHDRVISEAYETIRLLFY